MRRVLISLVSLLVAATWMFGCSRSEPHLDETTSELVAIAPGNGGSFGDLQVGATSTPMLIRVYPTGIGESYDTITDIKESCANFSITALSLPAEVSKTCTGGELPRVTGTGDSVGTNAALPCGGYDIIDYTFTATFAPTVAGLQSCVVSLTISDVVKTITLTGNGLPPPREIDLSRTSVAFGDVRVNTDSSSQTVVVSNTGSMPLTISSAALSASGSGAFTLTGAASTVIAANSTYTYSLTCKPTMTGALSNTLTIRSDDPDEPSLAVPLTCTGISSLLSVTPSPITIAARVAEPQELMVTLKNEGAASMNITAVTLTGAELELVNAPPLGIIPPNGSVQTRVRYVAKTEAKVAGSLTVRTESESRPITVTAEAKQAALSLDPDGQVDLGAVCVGNTLDKTFTAVAAGGAGFRISRVQAAGAGFAVAGASGPFDLRGGGGTTSVRITASPTAAGIATGAMVLATDIPGEPTRTVQLSATAIAAGVGAAPAEFDFGSMLVNEPTTVQRFALANCSGGPLTISSITLDGPDAVDFRVVEQPPAGSIAVGNSTSFPVEMRPRTSGSKQATLVVTHSAGVTEIPLVGDGFLPPQPIEEVGTYYACSSSTAGNAGLLLCGLVAGLALRRRRRRR